MSSESISFTAHYTGQVWQQHGLSVPELDTTRGRFYYRFMSPLEAGGKLLAGSDIKTSLLQRHLLIDYVIREKIARHPNLQIVEIAAGLSPRGTRFCEEFDDITYLETDLPEMSQLKASRIAAHLDDRHRVTACDVLDDRCPHNLANTLATLDPQRPVLVVMEGLINYFSPETMATIWGKLASGLSAFPHGDYVTDFYPAYSRNPLFFAIKGLPKLLGLITRSDFDFYFESDEALVRALKDQGFQQVSLYKPENYFDKAGLPRSRSAPFVQIVAAEC